MFHNILLLYKQHVFKYLNQIQFLFRTLSHGDCCVIIIV